jgi:sugar phosphate isomerase/epimerase
MKTTGANFGQLGIPGSLNLDPDPWKEAFAGFPLLSVACAFDGESYADIPTVKDTVGIIPPRFRQERIERILAAANFAAHLGIPAVTAHIGYPPPDHSSPEYAIVRDDVRHIADQLAQNSQTFCLETGQETAAELNHFLDDVDRGNVRINFDPANMILYGTGDPIEALLLVAPRVYSVHAKDGDWPPAHDANALGTERPLGQGSVNIPRFLAACQQIGFSGPIFIEREIEDHAQRLADMRMGLNLIRSLAETSAGEQ